MYPISKQVESFSVEAFHESTIGLIPHLELSDNLPLLEIPQHDVLGPRHVGQPAVAVGAPYPALGGTNDAKHRRGHKS